MAGFDLIVTEKNELVNAFCDETEREMMRGSLHTVFCGRGESRRIDTTTAQE